MKHIAICQSGYGELLSKELSTLRNVEVILNDEQSVIFEGKVPNKTVFPHFIGKNVAKISGDSVNNLAGQIFDYFITLNSKVIINSPFHVHFCESKSQPGLSRRVTSVSDAFKALLKKRMSRVAKLLSTDQLKAGEHRGLLVYFSDFGSLTVSVDFVYNGQRRMADDQEAPSRSYLKVEEAYGISGIEPQDAELVVDLGAAPGGWSYSAAKRGATVIAIDNGPLKGGALDNMRIIHKKTDAFKYIPEERVDWLFCDMVEEPHRIIDLITEWLIANRCRYFVINLKFGYVDPIQLIKEVEANEIISKTEIKIRHLYHDRDEITLCGHVFS